MFPRIFSISSISSLALIILLVAPANAAPSLGVGSKASYNLSLALNMSQSCNASPVANNRTACGPPVPAYHVYIVDSGACTSSGTCFFSPSNITVLPGNSVVWLNAGRIVHSIASCDLANSATATPTACPVMDNPGLNSFSSGASGLSSGQTFSYTFSVLGAYHYFDPIHPWMHGNVTVSATAPPPPFAVATQVTPPPISLSGNIGWTVVGLDSNTAVLNITHSLSVMIDSIPIAPVAESGSFQDSINLSTRAESHGTAVETIDNFALPLLALVLPGSSSGTNPFSAADSLSSSLPTIYTIWWVNGPVAKGSPVRILAGYSSVQGSETVSLPGGLGSRNAWIVSSNLAESLSMFSPQIASLMNPLAPSAPLTNNNAVAKLALKLDYDQSNDLLLASFDAATVTATSTGVYPPGALLCGSSGQCVTVSSLTTVTRVMTLSIAASLTLASTNLDFGSGGHGHGQQSSSNLLSALQNAMSQPVLITLAGVSAAGAASGVAWIQRRNRTKRPAGETLTAPPPPAP